MQAKFINVLKNLWDTHTVGDSADYLLSVAINMVLTEIHIFTKFKWKSYSENIVE